MKSQPIPCRIEPLLVRRIWGRLWLDPLYAASQEMAEPVGEVWLTGRDCRLGFSSSGVRGTRRGC